MVSNSKITLMPWPATHILIAEKFYPQHFQHLDHKQFIVGTCFPDIRYPAKIARKQTHADVESLSQVRWQSSFEAGRLFHNFVDRQWNAYVRQHEVSLFAEIPHSRPMFHALKILQDGYLYQLCDNWARISGYFDSLLPEERSFGVADWIIQRWHHLLAHYLSKQPGLDDLEMLRMSLPADLVAGITHCYLTYQDCVLVREVMVGFYADIQP